MMMGAKEANAMVSIIAALWVSGGVAVTSTQAINERRDVIMSGVLDGTPLSLLHRQTILYDDWVPLVIMMGLNNLVLAAFFIIGPLALKLNRSFKILCFICATLPVLGLVSWSVGGIVEYNVMQTILANETRAVAASSG